MITEDLTVWQKVLLAADVLDKANQSPFSAEQLVIAAWQEFPKTFGLRGYADQHPDSNKTLSSVMGERGLYRRGYFVKLGEKLYSLTTDGRQEIARLTNAAEPEPQKSRLPKHQDKLLQSLLSSSAVRKFQDGQKNDLTYADACRFWGLTQSSKGEEVDQKLQAIILGLNELDMVLANEDVELANKRIVTAGDLRFLRNVHGYMADRFERVLNLLRNRKG